MARTLTFAAGKAHFSGELIKVDRSKLYGSVSVETLDPEGRRCDLTTLARDGRTLIPYGGTAAGYLNRDGRWVEGNERRAVDVDGEPLDEVASSFAAPITLRETATVEELLDTPVRLAYRLGLPPERLAGGGPTTTDHIEEGDVWKYLDNGSNQGTAWRDPEAGHDFVEDQHHAAFLGNFAQRGNEFLG